MGNADFNDIPGTYVFDGDRAIQGRHLNRFCMSLMKAANRARFKAGQSTEEYAAMMRSGGRSPEGMELIMWMAMRGALGPKISELHRFHHVPASNTAVGHVVFTPEGS